MISLNAFEQQSFISLVNEYVAAKKNNMYGRADRLRVRLKHWQSFLTDIDYLKMVESGIYRYWPIGESPDHTISRVASR